MTVELNVFRFEEPPMATERTDGRRFVRARAPMSDRMEGLRACDIRGGWA
jgi:hypothetical protein